MGLFWLVDQQGKVLRCEEVWHLPGVAVSEFDGASRGFTFTAGVGLPGRVWASGAPAWIADVTRDDNFPRTPIAAKEGLHGACGFPIRFRRDILGVIEFFSPQIRQPDEALLAMMNAIGSQIGQFIERKRAEEARRESEARKAAILETALDSIITIDQEGRITEFNPAAEQIFGYRRAEALGREIAELIIPPSMRESHRRGLRITSPPAKAPSSAGGSRSPPDAWTRPSSQSSWPSRVFPGMAHRLSRVISATSRSGGGPRRRGPTWRRRDPRRSTRSCCSRIRLRCCQGR